MIEADALSRLTIVEEEPASSNASFALDVRRGLSASPKFLLARHLYDAIGSALYEAIVLLPEYYLTRLECGILRNDASAMLRRLGDVEIVELGPGDGRKSRIILEAALERSPVVRYHPIDISPSALRALSERLVAEYDRLIVTAHSGDYVRALRGRTLRGVGRVLVLFLGSSIGNYEPTEAYSLLRTISDALAPGDALLLGTDLKKSRDVLELAYDDPGGVTAAFNRNILARINRELGGTFDLRAFRFAVAYDERRGSVDSFQIALRAQDVRIAALDLDLSLAEGERIHTESSYKYDRAAIDAMAGNAGFSVVQSWTDAGARYAVSLLQKRDR